MKLIITILFLLFSNFGMAQNNIFSKFLSMSLAEQWWLVTHPLSAKKAYTITQETLQLVNETISDPELDGDYSGGQVDAFRHCFWMASLTQQIGARPAKKLGIAHEKGNYRQFKKHKLEEDILPDSVSCEMDLRNNKVGINLGKNNPKADKSELINLVKQAIFNGELWIIKKDKSKQFLDFNGNLLQKSDYQGRWKSPKCLVPSNFKQ